MHDARWRGLAALVLITATVGCKKEGAAPDEGGLPAELRPHPVHVDVGKLAVPALFASVPADTPYLVGALEAVPPAFYGKIKTAFGPIFGRLVTQLRSTGDGSALLTAILDELDGKWDEAGLESLGFSARPRFAIYGLGLAPVVARVELKSEQAVRATITRVVGRAGQALPEAATRSGRSYWRIAVADDMAAVVGFADNQLVAAFGKAADVDAKLDVILGITPPGHSMADAKPLKELMKRHGFGPQMIGFADTRKLASAALEAAGARPTPLCGGELDQLAARLPRVALGYGELTAQHASWGMVVELSPEVAASARSLKVAVPGLAEVMANQPLFAVGGGIDLAQGEALAAAAADRLRHLGEACGLAALEDGAIKAGQTFAQPLPDLAGLLTGGAAALRDIAIDPGGLRGGPPKKLDAVAVLASPDARVLFARLLALAPELRQYQFSTDGKLHDLQGGQTPLPFAVAAGVGDKSIVIAVGDQRAQLGGRLLAGRSVKSPLLAFLYDYGKLFSLIGQAAGPELDQSEPGMRAMYEAITKLFGRSAMTIDVTDHGIALWTSLEMR